MEMRTYTVRSWISSYTRIVNGQPVQHVVYSDHADRESAEYSAARAAARYDDVIAVEATPVDRSYEYQYCGENVYNGYDWHRDGTFSAKPGQEITPEIYEQMFDCLPPLNLPRNEATQGYTGGFLMSEPYDHVDGKAIYAAFARCGERCFFLGYMPAR